MLKLGQQNNDYA